MSASVTLTELWIHLVSDPSTYIQVNALSLQEDDMVPGEVRQSTTRWRWIKNGLEKKMYQIGAELLDRSTEADVLRTFKGVGVYVRDATGRLTFGVVKSLQIIESPLVEIGTVGFVVIAFEETYGTAEV